MPTAPAVLMLNGIKSTLEAWTTGEGEEAAAVFANVEISDF